MATITTRSGKGSPLTNSEVDANFTNLNSDKLEDAAGSIANDGSQYARQNGAWTSIAAGIARATTSTTAPSSPVDGDVWFSESNGVTYVYYDDGTSSQWVATGNPVSSPQGISALSELSDVSLTSLANNDFLKYNGTAWVNQQPSTVEYAEFDGAKIYANTSTTLTNATSFTQIRNTGSVTNTSGIFTFSDTGQWVIRLSATLDFSTKTNNAMFCRIELSQNSGSSFYLAQQVGYTTVYASDYDGTAVVHDMHVFNVLNTSTYRVRVRVGWENSNASSYITPTINFEKSF